MRHRMGLSLLLLVAVLSGLLMLSRSSSGEGEPSPAERLERVGAELDRSYWNEALALAGQADAIRPELQQALTGESPEARRLLAGRLLLELGHQSDRPGALEAIEELVLRSESQPLRLAAARLLELHAGGESDLGALTDGLSEIADPRVRIAAARVVQARGSGEGALPVLKELFRSGDTEIRAEAAIALGVAGQLDEPAVRSHLERLQQEPTPRGERARAVLVQAELYDAIQEIAHSASSDEVVKRQRREIEKLKDEVEELRERLASGSNFGNELLDETLDKIKRYYDYQDDEALIEEKRLIDHAVKGLVSSLDPYSSYMTEADTRSFNESMRQDYAGIGAVVSIDPESGYLTIIRPIYSGPAYELGLRSLDKVLEIDGEPTRGKSIQELVTLLKGTAGTRVRIKVFREGWQEARELVVTRGRITLKSVLYGMLPGKIGYLSLSQFGHKAVEEVEQALQDLEAQGMRALVFDLRDNAGGLLSAAISIASKFLPEGQEVVSSKGRNAYLAPARSYKVEPGHRHRTLPMMVLVNGASASASEIVAGALGAHDRAKLIGENTFGKGSVQQLLKVKATGGESLLRLTVARYYLPDGRNISAIGIAPDIEVEGSVPSAVEQEILQELQGSEAIEDYLDGLVANHSDRLAELARFDGFDPERYPGFEALRQELGAVDAGTLRRQLRAELRRRVQDRQGAQFPFDAQADRSLRRAIWELSRAAELDLSEIPLYAGLEEEFGE